MSGIPNASAVFAAEIFGVCNVADVEVKCAHPTPAIQTMLRAANTIPLERPAYKLVVNDATTAAFQMRSSTPLEIIITTNQRMRAIQLTTEVCPQAKWVTATGCYDCKAGFKLTISARASCG